MSSPSQMRLRTFIVMRPVCFFIILALLVLAIPSGLIAIWTYKAKEVEDGFNVVFRNINQEVVSEIQDKTSMFSPINSTTINLARFLSSSLDGNGFQFADLQSKVASRLFQALLTIPYLTEISYIGLDGLFFSYYRQGDQPFAMYANSTFSSIQKGRMKYTWYIQSANRDTGSLYGQATVSSPSDLVHSSWFQGALNNTNGYITVGSRYENSQDSQLLSTAAMSGTWVLSLGFPVKSLLNFFTAISFYNGSLYLATTDGKVLTQGIANTRMHLVHNQVSFQLFNSSGNYIGEVGNVTCDFYAALGRVETRSIWGKKYAISCSPIQIAGLNLISVLAVPHDNLGRRLHADVGIAFLMLIAVIIATAAISLLFVILIVHSTKNEMDYCDKWIKQMEATRQAERKSMNKSLAFASASHDVRAALAGIKGLIDVCRLEVQRLLPGSEVQTSLTQMEVCTKDLLDILNSILDMSKIEAGRMQLDEEEFDMEQLLEDVTDLYHPVGMKKGVDVVLDPHDGSIIKSSHVKGDRGKLKQILCNLLSNAVKFTSDGHVIVRAWARKPCSKKEMVGSHEESLEGCCSCLFFRMHEACAESDVSRIHNDPKCMEFVFEVIDTGKGIPKEKRKAVFENYVQVKETAMGQEGTGLGLGIVQSLVRLLGGEIEIVDKKNGEQGTCFMFNVFFSTCTTEVSGNQREDIETGGRDLSRDCYPPHPGPISRIPSPITDGSQVVLFIRCDGRRAVLQKFIEKLGVKVHVAKQHEQLAHILKKIKPKPYLSRSSSGRSNISSRSGRSRASSHASTPRLKEVPLSQLDGADESSSYRRRANVKGSVSSSLFVLMVIDVSAGPFREISRPVAEFRRQQTNTCFSRVVWLDRQGEHGAYFQGLDEDKLPPTDMIIYKPFHGSRLYRAIKLLPEFGGEIPVMEQSSSRGENPHYGSLFALPNTPVRMRPGPVMETLLKRDKEIEEVNGSSTESNMTGKKSMKKLVRYKSEAENNGSSSNQPLAGKTILIVDDDIIGRKIAMTHASYLGAHAFCCVNGKEAVDLVIKGYKDQEELLVQQISPPYSCILMDCEMPVMNGIEATRKIREFEKVVGKKHSIHSNIYALSAHDRGAEIDMMVREGVDGHVTKPLNNEKLLQLRFSD